MYHQVKTNRIMETKITFKTIIKNAEMACKRDGWSQIVYIKNDGEYAFTRLYSFLKLLDIKEVVAIVDGGFTKTISRKPTPLGVG